MATSTLPWVSANFLGTTTTVAGTDETVSRVIGSNGWLTFSGGAAMLVLGGLMIATSDKALRFLAVLVTSVTGGFAVYDVIRLLQKVHRAGSSARRLGPLASSLTGYVHIGYGLIVVASVSVAALGAAALETVANT